MGSNLSRDDEEEEGLPAKYARGCASSEFARPWLNNKAYQNNVKEDPENKSCVALFTANVEQDPSVRLLKKPPKRYYGPQRLQSIGIGSKQRSYLEQLIELRIKHGEEVYNEPNERSRKSLAKGGKIVEKTLAQLNLPENEHQGDGDKASLKKEDSRCKKQLSSPIIEPFLRARRPPLPSLSSISWTASSEEIHCATVLMDDSHIQQIRSDMTVVPFNQAKARFESGNDNKRPQKNEALVQLEKLGLGFWNNDQWVPTKVVTPAISDQLHISDTRDSLSRYSYRRNNLARQYYRSSYSEVN